MIAYGTTCKGTVVFLATELLPGVELTKAKRTPEVAQKAKDALQANHDAGLLHCDIEPHNIMIVERGCPTGEARLDVFILDFGFSKPVRSEKELAAEMRELEALF